MLLCGCGIVGDKTASAALFYGLNAILAFLLLASYLVFIKKKDFWFTMLYVAVLIVNIGYYLLSTTSVLDMALWANRISYFGSVLLPMSILMIILTIIKQDYKKWLPISLSVLAMVVFFIAATPGFSDIYYKEVSLIVEDGFSRLDKVYGDWHFIYFVYLVGYFGSMIGVIIYSFCARRIKKLPIAIIFAFSVFINLIVWLAEQLIRFEFEMLSISYIITEFFLLGVYIMINIPRDTVEAETIPPEKQLSDTDPERLRQFLEGVERLTRTERRIFELYINGKGTKEVLSELNIKENTLKFHNKNIYGKLGVSSRKQLVAINKAARSNV